MSNRCAGKGHPKIGQKESTGGGKIEVNLITVVPNPTLALTRCLLPFCLLGRLEPSGNMPLGCHNYQSRFRSLERIYPCRVQAAYTVKLDSKLKHKLK